MFKIIFTGRPGSGKGTQAKLLATHLQVPHISTGDIFRNHMKQGTPLGLAITASMNAGLYTSDDITNAVIKDRLAQSDVENGFILDGYPRTVAQVDFLEQEGILIDFVFNISVPEEVCITRLIERAKTSGRDDDTETVVRDRMNIYVETVHPVMNRYAEQGRVQEFDGNQTVADVHKQMVRYCN
jgi:adenylate kinase